MNALLFGHYLSRSTFTSKWESASSHRSLWSPCQATIYHQFHGIVLLVAELKMAEYVLSILQLKGRKCKMNRRNMCFNKKNGGRYIFVEMKTIPTKMHTIKTSVIIQPQWYTWPIYLTQSTLLGSAGIASFSKITSGGRNDLVFSTFPVWFFS